MVGLRPYECMQPEACINKMKGGVNERMRYVGVDVSKRKCRVAFIDEDGEIVDEFSFRNDFVWHIF